MMKKAARGHGVSGAINVYSEPRINIGNWVEDDFGVDIASKNRPGVRHFETEYMRLSKSSLMKPESEPSNIPSTAELKSKNKDGNCLQRTSTIITILFNSSASLFFVKGLPYGLIFDHGKSAIPTDDRFLTTYKSSSRTDLLASYALPEKALEREKIRKFRRDISLANDKTTETRVAQQHISFNSTSTIPLAAVGRSEDLPFWGRPKSVFCD